MNGASGWQGAAAPVSYALPPAAASSRFEKKNYMSLDPSRPLPSQRKFYVKIHEGGSRGKASMLTFSLKYCTLYARFSGKQKRHTCHFYLT